MNWIAWWYRALLYETYIIRARCHFSRTWWRKKKEHSHGRIRMSAQAPSHFKLFSMHKQKWGGGVGRTTTCLSDAELCHWVFMAISFFWFRCLGPSGEVQDYSYLIPCGGGVGVGWGWLVNHFLIWYLKPEDFGIFVPGLGLFAELLFCLLGSSLLVLWGPWQVH